MIQTFQGGCHCGQVRFEIQADLYGTEIHNCNCSMCSKKGFLHLHVKPSNFKLISGDKAIKEYRFNTKTARHFFCSECGIHSYYISRSHPHMIDINVRCLENIDFSQLTIVKFDGQNWEDNIDEIR